MSNQIKSNKFLKYSWIGPSLVFISGLLNLLAIQSLHPILIILWYILTPVALILSITTYYKYKNKD